jgi:hypothetical protein
MSGYVQVLPLVTFGTVRLRACVITVRLTLRPLG